MKKKVKGDRYNKKEALFAKSVIALNLLFIFSQLPYLILFVVKQSLSKSSSIGLEARVNFAYNLSQAIATYNYIFPTLVNFNFNRMFHDEVWSFLGIRIKKNMIESTKTNTGTETGCTNGHGHVKMTNTTYQNNVTFSIEKL